MASDFTDGVTLHRSLKSLDHLLSPFLVADLPIWSDPADSGAFLDAIDDLIAAIRAWTPMAADRSIAACLSLADEIMQRTMFRLQDEFRSLMERSSMDFEMGQLDDSAVDSSEDFSDAEGNDGGSDQVPVARPVRDYNIVIDMFSSTTINDLLEMAKRMVAAGYGMECSHVYSGCRREFLEESMLRLRLQKLSIEEVHQMAWQDVEDEIERWIKAINVSFRILFPSERRLCDRIFFGFTSAADLSFMEVCRGSTTQLLKFADAVAIGTRSPEKLYRILDLFATIRDLMPDVDMLFSDHYCLILRNEAIAISKRLGEAVKGIFMELENLIRRDSAKTAFPGGGIHPITRYVVNYLRAACQSRQTLEQIFEEENGAVNEEDSSSLAVQMMWMMDLLESNLEAKAKIYKDTALNSVFMMNNARYIVQKVNDSELCMILGDNWVRKQKSKVRKYNSNYQKHSWNPILDLLKSDDTYNSPPDVAAPSMKEKLRVFNSRFDEICGMQSDWVVSDDQLREELRASVTKTVLPAYGNFIGRFQNLPEIGKHPERFIRYSVEDVKARISDLFQERSVSADGRK